MSQVKNKQETLERVHNTVERYLKQNMNISHYSPITKGSDNNRLLKPSAKIVFNNQNLDAEDIDEELKRRDSFDDDGRVFVYNGNTITVDGFRELPEIEENESRFRIYFNLE